MAIVTGEAFCTNNHYDERRARAYLAKHRSGFWRRLSNLLEQRMAARALALAGHPRSVLDLPCGAGRFWRLLASVPDRILLGADYSWDMIVTALRFQPNEVARRFKVFRSSVFDIALSDKAVDCVFCMRLFHHIAGPGARARALRELHRVSRNTVCLSLWSDGNLQAWRRRRGRPPGTGPVRTRFVVDRGRIEREFLECGFEIAGSVALLPGLSMWCTYVLKKR